MCSPLGHSLAALAWVYGDINGYHHLGTHSIVAALIYAGLVLVVVRYFSGPECAKRWAWIGGLIYLSHIGLDFLSADDSAPRGLQIGWPFSSEFYISPVTVFPRFLHDTTGADMIGMITGLFSIHNFKTRLFECIVLLPIVWLVYRFNRTIETNS